MLGYNCNLVSWLEKKIFRPVLVFGCFSKIHLYRIKKFYTFASCSNGGDEVLTTLHPKRSTSKASPESGSPRVGRSLSFCLT